MPSFVNLFLDSFEDRTLQILLGSAILSMILGITVANEEYFILSIESNPYFHEILTNFISGVDGLKESPFW